MSQIRRFRPLLVCTGRLLSEMCKFSLHCWASQQCHPAEGAAEESGIIDDAVEWWDTDPEGVIESGIALGLTIGAGLAILDDAEILNVNEELSNLGDIDIPELPLFEGEACGWLWEVGLEGGDVNFEDETLVPEWEIGLTFELEDGNSISITIPLTTAIDLSAVDEVDDVHDIDDIDDLLEDIFEDPVVGKIEVELVY